MPDIEHNLMPDALPIEDWDDAYANAAHIPNSDGYIEQWAGQSAAFRKSRANSGKPMISLPYGSHERHLMDVFEPDNTPAGIAVFVHGGYWLRFSQGDWSHLASGALENQHITAMVGYPLCPESSIGAIAISVGNAVNAIAQRYPGLPVYLAGHSAGGHLVSHLMCQPDALDEATQKRIKRVLSISGVHDLVPLTKTAMNDQLGLSLADATDLSPARLRPKLSCPVIAWVGGAERPEFVRQNALLETAWSPLGTKCETHVQAERHHFDVC